jgi:hypothetical protein|tara:strand:+ start:610 stop:765 length:156 start_codon:yes stop_codon:yes gene_type:complete
MEKKKENKKKASPKAPEFILFPRLCYGPKGEVLTMDRDEFEKANGFTLLKK